MNRNNITIYTLSKSDNSKGGYLKSNFNLMSTVLCHSGLWTYSRFSTIGTRARQTQPGSPGLSAFELDSVWSARACLFAFAIPRLSEISFNLRDISRSRRCLSSRLIDAKSASRLKIGRDHFEISFRAKSRFSLVSFGWLENRIEKKKNGIKDKKKRKDLHLQFKKVRCHVNSNQISFQIFD